jgi:general L-amino acid transport system substrate-binding protein
LTTPFFSKSTSENLKDAIINYGELFERHLGSATPLGLERGLNRLWSRGGLHIAPPFR